MALTNMLNVYEVIEQVTKEKNRANKISILQKNNSWALKDVLRCTYDDLVQWS